MIIRFIKDHVLPKKPEPIQSQVPADWKGPRPFYGARHGFEFEKPRAPLPEARITYFRGGLQAECPMPDFTLADAAGLVVGAELTS